MGYSRDHRRCGCVRGCACAHARACVVWCGVVVVVVFVCVCGFVCLHLRPFPLCEYVCMYVAGLVVKSIAGSDML